MHSWQAFSGEGALQQSYPRKTWTRPVEAAVLACAGDDACDFALHRSNWAASHGYFVNWCSDAYRRPALA